jgi:hypothetical protein
MYAQTMHNETTTQIKEHQEDKNTVAADTINKLMERVQQKYQNKTSMQLADYANNILWHYPVHGNINHDRSSMMPTPGTPFGIPEHITRWAIDAFSLTHQRLTHPRCESQEKRLRPTYWE